MNIIGNKLIISIIIFVFVAAIAAFIYINESTLNTTSSTTPAQASLDSLKRLNDNDSVLSFPGQKSAESAQSTESFSFPEEIQSLLIATAENLSSKEILYENDKGGFEIEYSVPMLLRDAYILISINSRSLGWTMLVGSRTNTAGILEIENSAYQARIASLYLDDDNTLIRVTVINK